MEWTVLHIQDMECTACAERIEQVLRAMRGVEAVEASFLSGTVRVQCDPACVSAADLERGIRRAGCSVSADGSAPAPRRAQLLRMTVLAAVLLLPLLWPLDGRVWLAFAVLDLVLTGRFLLRIPAWAERAAVAAAAPAVAFGAWLMFAQRSGGRLCFALAGLLLLTACSVRYLQLVRAYRAAEPARKLLRFQPRMAAVLCDGQERQTWVDALRPGDMLVIRSGERIPADSVIVSGACLVDESLFSADRSPVEKHVGDTIRCGTLLRSGEVQATVTAAGADSMLCRRAAALLQGGDERRAK